MLGDLWMTQKFRAGEECSPLAPVLWGAWFDTTEWRAQRSRLSPQSAQQKQVLSLRYHGIQPSSLHGSGSLWLTEHLPFTAVPVTSRHCRAGQSHGQKSGSCSLLIVPINPCIWGEFPKLFVSKLLSASQRRCETHKVEKTDTAVLLLCARET